MADSDNTTTLPFVTGRVFGRTANATVESQPTGSVRDGFENDPAVAIWRDWLDAHKLTERLCHEQQRLERKLAETIGFPRAMILRSNGERATLYSLSEILDVGLIDEESRAKAEADFADYQMSWDAADRQIGYSAALVAEREAADRAEELLEALSETPATSLAGVAAKLDAVLREGSGSKDEAEFPWPQIRSAFDDIGRLVGKQI